MEAPTTWIVLWVAIHLTALSTAVATRLATDSSFEGIAQSIFYLAMLTMAAAIWFCQQASDSAWGLSAITLVAMVITAVIDFRKFGDARSVGQMH
jgi:Na+/alanine symporter